VDLYDITAAAAAAEAELAAADDAHRAKMKMGRGSGGSGGGSEGGQEGEGGGGGDLYDITSAAAAAEAEITAANGAERAAAKAGASFAPQVDVFAAPEGWMVHVAVPGAKREDVGVRWDGARSVLRVSGTVRRPGGGERAWGQMAMGEREMGRFEREIELPPSGGVGDDKGAEVDGDGIGFAVEDGVMAVTVPKKGTR
jgi:HSP20 family protein